MHEDGIFPKIRLKQTISSTTAPPGKDNSTYVLANRNSLDVKRADAISCDVLFADK